MEFLVNAMQTEDWEAVRAIYCQGIETGDATFETAAPDWEEWDARHLRVCRLVARWTPGNEVVGWAAVSPYSHRRVYAGVAEVSIYVSQAFRGRGIGKLLLGQLITESEANGIWTLQAGIFPENLASLRLHQSSGFRQVGRRERIGKVNNTWRDVILLERRSAAVGC